MQGALKLLRKLSRHWAAQDLCWDACGGPGDHGPLLAGIQTATTRFEPLAWGVGGDGKGVSRQGRGVAGKGMRQRSGGRPSQGCSL